MSKTIISGRVLGTASTAGGSTALPAMTGHRSLAIYAVGVAVGCAVLILLSKCIKRVLERRYVRPL